MEGKGSQFWALIARYERILLTTHVQADLDAIASVLVLQYLIGNKFPMKVIKLFFNGIKGFALNFCKGLLKTDKQSLPLPEDIDLCILIDSNNFSRTECGDFFEKFSGARVIIDHHLPPDSTPQNVLLSYFDPDRPSCVEVMLDLMVAPVFFPLDIRRIMVAGLFSDSKNLTLCDSKSFKVLSQLLDNDLKLGDITRFLQEEPNSSERIARLKGAQRANIQEVGPWIIATTNVSSFEAQVDNGLISLGADVAFVISKQKTGKCRIIGRASPAVLKTGKFNFGEIFRSLQGEEIESAGGHLGAAGVSFTGNPDQVMKEILKRTQALLSEITKNSQE